MTFIIAIPTLDFMTSDFMQGLLHLEYPMVSHGKMAFIRNREIPLARLSAINRAIKENHEYLLFIDDDIILPPDTFLKLFHSINKKIKGKLPQIMNGVYYRKTDCSHPLVFKKIGAGALINMPKDKVIPVEACGLGCTLIRVKMLKKLIKTNKNIFDMFEKSVLEKTTEDISFYKALIKNDIQNYVDTSVQVGHQAKKDYCRIYYKGGSYIPAPYQAPKDLGNSYSGQTKNVPNKQKKSR